MKNQASAIPIGKRVEADSMGEMLVPEGALWGASTERAVQNFPISSLRFGRSFIKALSLIKLSAARANLAAGDLDSTTAAAIISACLEAASGSLDDHFVVDIFQTGSGTSTNMNANEVIASRARQLLGKSISERNLVHPNDHVNMGQSSNDVIPTAIHLAVIIECKEVLIPALQSLSKALGKKARSFAKVIKTGRTHLQDATPVTLGQEFAGYKVQVDGALKKLKQELKALSHVTLGGTAVGTGINTRKEFARETLTELSKVLGFKVQETKNHLQAQGSIDELVQASGVLQTLATSLLKIVMDIRWMASGPRSGIAELLLPTVQPGSSIMPGKVNPVICESTMQVCFKVLGNCQTVIYSTQASNFELNVALPVVAHSLLESITLLGRAVQNFELKCIEGLTATKNGPALVERGLALCTALAPEIGYDKAAKIAKEADQTGETIFAVALRQSGLSEARLKEILDPFAMTRPGASSGKKGD